MVYTSGKTNSELADMLKMKEYGVKKNREAAASFGQEKLTFIVNYLYECTSGVKCGRITPQSAFKLARNYIFFS